MQSSYKHDKPYRFVSLQNISWEVKELAMNGIDLPIDPLLEWISTHQARIARQFHDIPSHCTPKSSRVLKLRRAFLVKLHHPIQRTDNSSSLEVLLHLGAVLWLGH